jgi:hypothetical protein
VPADDERFGEKGNCGQLITPSSTRPPGRTPGIRVLAVARRSSGLQQGAETTWNA